MRKYPRALEEAPAGFELHYGSAGVELLLPTELAREQRAQRLAREADAQLRKHEDFLAGVKEESRNAEVVAKASPRRKRLRKEPRQGWYRVLPGLAQLSAELVEGFAERSADRDVNERRKRIIERLSARGPDRRVAVPTQWRKAVDELEQALPHFRAPIRSLRHALALAEATNTPPRLAPQLLLGPPGVGKTFFTNRVAELFGTARASVQFDQPGAGAQLRGSDKYWANSEPGLLFNLVCLGEVANPVILLDEVDKACDGNYRHGQDQLAQLHGALERETARCLRDVSVDIEFDASLVTYFATANSLAGIGAPIVSRMEVSVIQPPDRREAMDIAAAICQEALRRLQLDGQVHFERPALVLLAQLSPRLMLRAAEKALAAAVAAGRKTVGEEELWTELDGGTAPRLH